MVRLISHNNQWIVMIGSSPAKFPSIEDAAEFIEANTAVSPDTIDSALIYMYEGGCNCADFTIKGELQHVGVLDVEII